LQAPTGPLFKAPRHVYRPGGDEIVILLPKTDIPTASDLAERIRAEIESAHLPYAGKLPAVTCSAGVAAFPTHVSVPRQHHWDR